MRPGVLCCAVAGCGVAAGCASSTGVLPAGPDTYTLSEKFAPVRGGSDEAQRSVLTKAKNIARRKADSSFHQQWVKAGLMVIR